MGSGKSLRLFSKKKEEKKKKYRKKERKKGRKTFKDEKGRPKVTFLCNLFGPTLSPDADLSSRPLVSALTSLLSHLSCSPAAEASRARSTVAVSWL